MKVSMGPSSGHLMPGYFLGLFGTWDNRMFIPPEKISRIFSELLEVMSCGSVSARKLARVTWKIVSNFLIIGDVCKLMTKKNSNFGGSICRV